MKKSLITIIVIIILVILGVYIWKNSSTDKTVTLPPPANPETTAQPLTTEPKVVTEAEKTPVEKYFDGIKAVEPNTEKGKTVQTTLLLIMQKIYDTKVDEKTVAGVKLQEQFGSMFTYVCNRVVTQADMTAVKTDLVAQGYKVAEESGKSMTMMKVGQTLVLTFWIDNQQKAGLEVTF